MTVLRAGLARARARAGVLAAFAVVVLVVTALSAAILGALGTSAETAVRGAFADAAPNDRAERWQIRTAPDARAQAAAAAAILDERLGGVGVEWMRDVATSPVRLDDAHAAVFLADDAIAERAELEAGSWPEAGSGPDAEAPAEIPAAVHAGALEALGAAVGDVLHPVEGPAIRIVGSWTPTDAADPVWFGDPLAAGGASGNRVGPFVVAEASLAALPAGAYTRWTAIPDAGSLASGDLGGIRAAVLAVEPLLRADPDVGTDGVTTSGGLADELDRLDRAAAAVRALAPVPVLLVGVAGALAVQRLAALLLEARQRETLLLRARGASGGWFARHALAETLAVAVPAALVGAGLAAAFLVAVGAGLAVLVPVAAGTVLGCAVIVGTATWIDARRPAVRDGGAVSGRAGRGLAAGVALVLAVLTGLAFWRFVGFGSPVAGGAAGAGIDPLAVAAPVLGLLTASVAAVLVLPVVTGALASRAARRPDLVPVLPLRQLSRRASLHRAAVLLTVLATGGAVLASAAAGGWARLDEANTLLQTGGELRVELLGETGYAGEDEPVANPLEGRPGVRDDVRALVAPARAGSLPVTFVAADGIRPAGADPADRPAGERLPVVVTDALASAIDAEPGDAVDLRLEGGGVKVAAVVAETRGALPRVASAGVAADYEAFAAHQLAAGERVPLPGERWADADAPAAIAAELNREQPVPLVARDRQAASSAPFAEPVFAAFLAGGAGSLALALLGVVALAATLARERSSEALVLRAVGMAPRAQARARAIELGATVVAAAVLGTVAGVLVAAATVPGLARAAVATAPPGLSTVPAFAWAPWLVLTALFLGAAALVVRAAARRVAREAAEPGRRAEEP